MRFLYFSFLTALFINIICIIVLNWSGYWVLRPAPYSSSFYDSFMRGHPNRDFKEAEKSRDCIERKVSLTNQIIHIDTNDKDTILWLSRGGIYLFPASQIIINDTFLPADRVMNLSQELRECNK